MSDLYSELAEALAEAYAITDWERDTGLPWPMKPVGRSYYADHHYDEGRLIVGQDGPWRIRDLLARAFGWHCWECWKL